MSISTSRSSANLGAPHVLLEILDSRDDQFDREGDLRVTGAKEGPAIQHLFHGYPLLSKITEPVSIGPFNAPDSTLKIGVEWLPNVGDASEKPSAAVKDPELSTDSELTPALALERLVKLYRAALLSTDSELTPALTLAIGGSKRVFRLDEDFASHSRRWQYQPRSFLDLATPCLCVGPNGLSAVDQEKMWERIALSDLERDVIESLNIVYPGVDALAVLAASTTRKPSVRVKHPSFAHPHPLKSLGDGAIRLFGLTLALVTAQRGILLIDEIENGIHYSVLPAVWKFAAKVAKRLNVQVFVTSHSLDCIKAFHEVTHADPAIEGVLNRIEIRKGVIQAVLFDDQKLDRFLEEGIEMR